MSFSVREGATDLLLIRHADASGNGACSDANVTHGDMPLTERGRAQAELLAARLRRHGITAVFSSHLRRAVETAQILARDTGAGVSIDDRLREVDIAGAETIGLRRLAEIAVESGGWSHLDGTETSESIRSRMRAAIGDIVQRNAGGRVAIVSHAGAINAYIASLLGLQIDFFFPAGNTSITVVRASDERRLIFTINDIAHLDYARGTV